MSTGLHLTRMAGATALVLAALSGASGAQAAVITYYFSGNFQSVELQGPAALVGTAFSGSLTYDLNAAATLTAPNSLSYAAGATLTVQTVLGTGQTGNGTAAMRSTWDAFVITPLAGAFDPADELVFGGPASLDAGLAAFNNGMSLQLVDDALAPSDDPFGGALSHLPYELPLAAMEAAEFHLSGAGVVNGVLRLTALAHGSLNCLSQRAQDCAGTVPEPAALLLVLTALAAARGTSKARPGQPTRIGAADPASMDRPTASATSMPSTPALMMPPA